VRGIDVRIESSLLGRNVRVGQDRRQPRAYRLMVGDNSEIAVP
jgi:glucose-1-phosphate thymidylyltransferase